MDSISLMVVENIKRKILKDYPTRRHLDGYFTENNSFPADIIKIMEENDVSYYNVKEWLYSSQETTETEKARLKKEIEYLKQKEGILFTSLLSRFPKKEDLDNFFEENLYLPKEFISIIDKVKEVTYKDLVDLVYSVATDNNISMYDIVNVMTSIDHFAKKHTTDPKVYVGAVVGKVVDGYFSFKGVGCNKNDSYNEKELGHTYREYLFGSRDKKYRPWDKIVHAEENAIVNAIETGSKDGDYDTAIVTRYPCEKCAQLMVYKGIKQVFYGRKFNISEETESIFRNAGVAVIHVVEYEGDPEDDNL